MSSLRDQLLKAGVASKQQAKKSSKAVAHQKRTGQSTQSDQARAAAEAALQAKRDADKAANQAQQAARLAKEIDAQARDIIRNSALPRGEGEHYQFQFDGKVKEIGLSATLRSQIVAGQAAIACADEQFFVIPAKAAEKVAERRAELIAIHFDKASDAVDEDDPYADYQIPDDLMW
ncbi:MAG: DUF2058 domain-containing protein [Gammaproteobacteria bacterium]|nr:DUF2058 domain-containing protein [Gammaproteobacteria bacterium]